jgi:lipopolysaccharide biosynthesis protein
MSVKVIKAEAVMVWLSNFFKREEAVNIINNCHNIDLFHDITESSK